MRPIIAFDRLGEGPPVILVLGAFNTRETGAPLAEALARTHTVINYDRRGRGDSGDSAPYAVEREIEDLDALIHEVGGKRRGVRILVGRGARARGGGTRARDHAARAVRPAAASRCAPRTRSIMRRRSTRWYARGGEATRSSTSSAGWSECPRP